MGNSMSAVALLLTNMERPAPATIRPSTSPRGPRPVTRNTRSAMRRCSPLASIARAISIPPMKSQTRLLPASASTEPSDAAPASGSTTNATHAVPHIGSASVIHHAAISSVTATTDCCSPVRPRVNHSETSAAAGPSHKPACLSRRSPGVGTGSCRAPAVIGADRSPGRSIAPARVILPV
jgi:hypothetical protein